MYKPKHFSLLELINTSTTTLANNIPSWDSLQNLTYLCKYILDPLRDQLLKVEKWSNDSYVCENLSIYYFYPLTDVDIMRRSYSEIVSDSSVLRASYADYAADNRERIKHKALNDKNALLIAAVDKKPV